MEHIVREMKQRAIDITIIKSCGGWLLRLWTVGENGRVLSPHYEVLPLTIKEKPTNNIHIVLQSKGQGITIRSFFILQNQAGISLAPFNKEHFSILPNIQNGKTGKWIKSEEELPAFPECVFEHLPPFLNEVVNNSISLDDRDTILIGAIVCLSHLTFPGVVECTMNASFIRTSICL